MKILLSQRLDEAAVAVRSVTNPRLALTAFCSAIAALILPWTYAAVWLGGTLVLELWLWIATGVQARGGRTGGAAQMNFSASFIAINLSWLALGLLMWTSGSAAGQACAAVLSMTLVSLVILLFYATPVVFFAMGALPATSALLIVARAGGQTWLDLAPVLLAMICSLAFVLGRAYETPSAQAQQRAVNQSLEQYQVLADNVTDVIARTDMDGVHTYLSPSVESVLGYRPDELVGVSRFNLIDPRDHVKLGEAGERMRAEPGRSEVVSCRVRHKDGRWLWLQTSARFVCEHGVPVGVIDVSRDITDQVNLNRALQEAKTEAESATLAKAEFLANISHEIRTPMNGILGALQLLDQEPISSDGRELMRQAADCGQMLSQLLNDVLDFSKIEAGQMDLTSEPMHVPTALNMVTAVLEGQAHAKGLDLRCEVEGGDLWISADPVRVRQAMFNLVGNAIKFTDEGHVTVRLCVSSVPEGRRHVRLEVEDTGIGIAEDAQSLLYERFRQVEGSTARRHGGSGLGLSITRALAGMMGGDVDFTSVQGEGSVFRLQFSAPAAEPVMSDAVDGGLLDGMRILLVEDNPTNRLVARTLLTRLGAEVEEAEDGLVGLEAARTSPFDLILMDVQMPNMDGIAATRAIRTLEGPAAHVPILGLTANVMVHQQAAYLAAGMNGVVAKPISTRILIGELARLLHPDDTAIAV